MFFLKKNACKFFFFLNKLLKNQQLTSSETTWIIRYWLTRAQRQAKLLIEYNVWHRAISILVNVVIRIRVTVPIDRVLRAVRSFGVQHNGKMHPGERRHEGVARVLFANIFATANANARAECRVIWSVVKVRSKRH